VLWLALRDGANVAALGAIVGVPLAPSRRATLVDPATTMRAD
jgi:hypothetical protein